MQKILLTILIIYTTTSFASNNCYSQLTSKDKYSDLNTILICMDKKIIALEQKIKEIKDHSKTSNLQDYYKLPNIPEENKSFTPPLKKTITLCEEPFYFIYYGFYNKEKYIDNVTYKINYGSTSFGKSRADVGDVMHVKGNKYVLTLRYIQLSDDGKNPIFTYTCKKK